MTRREGLCLDSQTTMGVFFTADMGQRLRAMQTYKGRGIGRTVLKIEYGVMV